MSYFGTSQLLKTSLECSRQVIMTLGHVARISWKRNACRISVGKPEGKSPCGPRCRWENNIKMELRVVGWDEMD
jgi:hypothetical protein